MSLARHTRIGSTRMGSGRATPDLTNTSKGDTIPEKVPHAPPETFHARVQAGGGPALGAGPAPRGGDRPGTRHPPEPAVEVGGAASPGRRALPVGVLSTSALTETSTNVASRRTRVKSESRRSVMRSFLRKIRGNPQTGLHSAHTAISGHLHCQHECWGWTRLRCTFLDKMSQSDRMSLRFRSFSTLQSEKKGGASTRKSVGFSEEA